jgi:hypothetical protein
MIETTCAACGKRLRARDDAAGKRGNCPKCGAAVQIPEAEFPYEVVEPVPVFGRKPGKTLVVEAFWCESPIKLPTKVQTPLGRRVTVINVCVDVHFSFEDGNVVLQRVALSRGGGRISGSSLPINVSSQRTGEAWYASSIAPESALIEAVKRDLSVDESRLGRIMLGKWRAQNRPALVRSLVDALNAHASPEEIEGLITTAGRGNDIVFTYTKANGASETRRVCVRGVLGNSIRATDRKDEKVKSFRIDRITNARNGN